MINIINHLQKKKKNIQILDDIYFKVCGWVKSINEMINIINHLMKTEKFSWQLFFISKALMKWLIPLIILRHQKKIIMIGTLVCLAGSNALMKWLISLII